MTCLATEAEIELARKSREVRGAMSENALPSAGPAALEGVAPQAMRHALLEYITI